MNGHIRFYTASHTRQLRQEGQVRRESPRPSHGQPERILSSRGLNNNMSSNRHTVIVLSDSEEEDDDEEDAPNREPEPIDLTNDDDASAPRRVPIILSQPRLAAKKQTSLPLLRGQQMPLDRVELTRIKLPLINNQPKCAQNSMSAPVARQQSASQNDGVSTPRQKSQPRVTNEVQEPPSNGITPQSTFIPQYISYHREKNINPLQERVEITDPNWEKAVEKAFEEPAQFNAVEKTQPSANINSPVCDTCNFQSRQCDGLRPCTQCNSIGRGDRCTYLMSPLPSERRSLVVRLPLLSPSNIPSGGNLESPTTSEHEPGCGGGKSNGMAGSDNAMSNNRASTETAKTKAALQNRQIRTREGVENNLPNRLERDEPTGGLDREISDSEAHTSETDIQLDNESDATGKSTDPVDQDQTEPDIETVRRLVERLRRDLHAWQEEFVQADLRKATVAMRGWPRARLDSTLSNPFQKITQERMTASGNPLPSPERPQQRKLTIVRAPESSFWTGSILLPKYKAIGRVSSSFLAPNFRTAKYRPYDAEDEIQDPEATEKYAELEQRFNNNYDSLKAQRSCQEQIWLWRPWADELLSCLGIERSDILYYYTVNHFDPGRQCACGWSAESSKAWREEQFRRCRTCELVDPESRWTHFSETFSKLPVPDDRSLALAGLAAHAFHEMTRVSLWHIALGGILQPRYEDPQAIVKKGSTFCVICYRHQCPDHGSYEEPIDEDRGVKDPEELKAFINDEEQDRNLRKFMILPTRTREESAPHVCGLFCVDTSQNLRQLIGRREDGCIAGDSRPTPQTTQRLEDDDLCGPSCFWDVANRPNCKMSDINFRPFISHSQKLLVEKLMQFYMNNKRGPCLIARIVKDIGCLMVFHHMVFRISRVPHPGADAGLTSDSSTAQRHHNHMRKKKKPVPTIDVSRSAELDQRPPFIPCSHDGPCYNNPACTCSRSKVHCERFCGCDDSCKRRFRGCSCTTRGSKNCFKDSRCECWKHNRECDPYLCGKCGVIDVLDSSNKYRDEVRKGRCKNNRIQLGLPAPTTKAPSQVQGYGLYSRAEIASGDFIGEYTGEVISISEGDRRGAMYHVLNQEYLFVINKGQEIDASNHGNKMRFMNNSQREEHINVEPKKLWCSGVVRVGLFAKRLVRAGEELLYNYNYPESVVKNFWEPGERPANARGLIPLTQERLARTTGANKLAEENGHDMHDDNGQSPSLTRRPKRKRPVGESPLLNGMDSETSTDEILEIPAIDDSEDSDYETNDLVSDEGDSDEDSDEDSDLGPIEEPQSRGGSSSNGRPRRAIRNSSLQGRWSSGSKTVRNTKSGEINGLRDGSTRRNHSRNNLDSRSRSKKDISMVGRQRRIGPNDKRYGGKAQQQAWRTRRLNESLGIPPNSISPRGRRS
ncbi:uncharacterized protein Z518_10587 [Rhinocladiella mackenziei CBS 650.93]|uniref:Uncharacterized protein n=1 Tax=Rhinocladiella mackenziei CBS 650.93 TaxID=1442369 RepID=A0A0D2GQ59_9EURO|nr:uncharacterized protein Z518_10587 [Rhinocladiella mackenziei CBS 650.93]KIX00448.1 hypothetical protein Z518_10587 [Rhinocladiella mackenziei CBS 650.93]